MINEWLMRWWTHRVNVYCYLGGVYCVNTSCKCLLLCRWCQYMTRSSNTQVLCPLKVDSVNIRSTLDWMYSLNVYIIVLTHTWLNLILFTHWGVYRYSRDLFHFLLSQTEVLAVSHLTWLPQVYYLVYNITLSTLAEAPVHKLGLINIISLVVPCVFGRTF